jgi:hypothetical protein
VRTWNDREQAAGDQKIREENSIHRVVTSRVAGQSASLAYPPGYSWRI